MNLNTPPSQDQFDYFHFCPLLREMLKSNEVTLSDGSSVGVKSASTVNNLKAIRQVILKEKPVSTLEIGLALGASALTFLGSLQEVNDADFFHTAIDPFQNSQWQGIGVDQIERGGLSKNFRFIEQDSMIALPSLCERDESFEVIYVDGNHKFENVFVDFLFGVRLLSSNGMILFDDCTFPQVKKVIKFIDKNYPGILRRENIKLLNETKTLKKQVGNLLGIRQLIAYRKIGKVPRRWDAYSNF